MIDKPFFTCDHQREDIEAGRLTCGAHTYGRLRIHHWKGRENGVLHVGRFCSIAAGVEVFLGGNHRPDWVALYPFNTLPRRWGKARGITGQPTTRGDVRIGSDVWIGAGSVIMSGVSIGDGAVLAARALVTKDVAPFEIVGGNPARHLRWRFDEETIRRLRAVAWWDWPDDLVADHAHLLAQADIAAFLDIAESLDPARIAPR